MKTRYLFLVPLSCMLLLACENGNSKPNISNDSTVSEESTIISNDPSDTSVEVSNTSQESQESQQSQESKPSSESTTPAEKLPAPIGKVNESLMAYSWSKVTNASSYSVQVDNSDPVVITNTIYELPNEVGNHTIKVIAKSGTASYSDSDPNEYIYDVLETELGELTYAEGVITWESFVGVGLEYKLGDGEYQTIEGNSLSASQQGSYTLKAKSGFTKYSGRYDCFYIDSKDKTNSRTIIVSKPASEELLLEGGRDRTNAGLQEKYTVQKYDNDNWNASSASISLDESNTGYTDGKCVKFQFYRHNAWFKYEKLVTIPGTYDTLKFFAKCAVNSSLIISFEIKEEKLFGDTLIKGVYITYKLTNPSTEWTEYSISMSDPGWQIDFGDGNKLNNENFIKAMKLKGIKIGSLADTLPYFDAYQVRCYSANDENWSVAYDYLDEIKLANTGEETAVKPIIKMKDLYAFQGGDYSGNFVPGADGKGVFNVLKPQQMTINANYEITSQGKLKVTSTTEGFDFEGILAASHNGDDFILESASGENASLLPNLKLGYYSNITDFESYSATGVGYDYNQKDTTLRSGLRADYYCDFYDGSTNPDYASPLGGNGWSLMRSADYLELNTDAANAHTGTKSMRLKYNSECDCRYISYGLYDSTATMLPSGSIFSFWVKGVETRVNKLRVKVYSVKQVNASNQISSSAYVQADFEIPQGSEWHECKIELKSTEVYYGFSIMPNKYNGSGAYFFVDDFSIYNNVSPWGE